MNDRQTLIAQIAAMIHVHMNTAENYRINFIECVRDAERIVSLVERQCPETTREVVQPKEGE